MQASNCQSFDIVDKADQGLMPRGEVWVEITRQSLNLIPLVGQAKTEDTVQPCTNG